MALGIICNPGNPGHLPLVIIINGGRYPFPSLQVQVWVVGSVVNLSIFSDCGLFWIALRSPTGQARANKQLQQHDRVAHLHFFGPQIVCCGLICNVHATCIFVLSDLDGTLNIL